MSSIRSNFHMHSLYSDGTAWPEEQVVRAFHLGLEQIALTDHDSMEGVEEFLHACSLFNLKGIAAAEVDSIAPEISFDMELLAYFPAGNYGEFKSFLRERLEERENILRGMINRAAKLFDCPQITFLDFLTFRMGGMTFAENSRPLISFVKYNLYEYLTQLNVLPEKTSYQRFKREYYQADQLGLPAENKPHLTEIVERVKALGGYCVLPHPAWALEDFGKDQTANHVEKKRQRLVEILTYCQKIGVWGIELNYYGKDTAAINGIITVEAEKLGFPMTPGSDCHGRGSAHQTMEYYQGEFGCFPE